MRRTICIVATAIGLLALPGASLASAASSSGVTHYVGASSKALAELGSLTRHHHYASARRALKRARHEVAGAARQARSLRAAVSGQPTTTVADAFAQVATAWQSLLSQCAAMVGQTNGSLQSDVANCLAPSLNGREQAIQTLDQLIAAVPVAARGPIADVIASLTKQSPTDTTSLVNALQSGALPTEVSTVVSQALANASGLIQFGVDQLKAVIATLPSAAQGPVSQALSQVVDQLNGLVAQLQGLVSSAAPGTSGSTGTTTALPQIPAGIGQELQQVIGLIKQFMGQFGAIVPSAGGSGGSGSPPGSTPGSSTGSGPIVLGGLPSISSILNMIPMKLPSFISGLIPGGLSGATSGGLLGGLFGTGAGASAGA